MNCHPEGRESQTGLLCEQNETSAKLQNKSLTNTCIKWGSGQFLMGHQGVHPVSLGLHEVCWLISDDIGFIYTNTVKKC